MKHFKWSALFACVAMLFAGVASAGMQYTYVQASLKQSEGTDGDDSDAHALKGSLALGDSFHVGLELGGGTDEGQDGDFDNDSFTLGWHTSLNENTDILAEATFGDWEWEDEPFDNKGDYTAYTFGIRHMLADSLEIGLSTTLWDNDSEVGCACSGDGDDDVSATISGRFHINDSASVGVTWIDNDPLLDDDDGAIQFDLRWAFGDG